jgi:hypothetical protein
MISAKPLSPVDPRVYRPRRKPVSIAIGYVYDEGIVFCADTKITTKIKTTESKLDFFCSSNSYCAMTFAMASDDLNFPKSASRACWEMVKKMDLCSCSLYSVRDMAEIALAKFYRDHIYTHPDRQPGAVYFEMLVAIWLRGETRLFSLHETLLTPVDDYECIGAGATSCKLTAGAKNAYRIPINPVRREKCRNNRWEILTMTHRRPREFGLAKPATSGTIQANQS